MILETAIGGGKVMQGFDPESLPTGGPFTTWECEPPVRSDSESKPCITLPPRTAVSRMIRLSICMPTYNFGKFIGETLDSILPQLSEEVELVIVDGASTDNTPEVVARYQSPYIRYHRLPAKGGIDQDMNLSVQLASGEYCWLFSSDDVMNRDAIALVLKQIRLGIDAYLLGFDISTLNIQEHLWKHPLFSVKKNIVFDLSNKSERLSYFQKAVTTTAFFSFMSSIVIKRSRWIEVPYEETFIGGCWAHAARILRLIPNGLTVKSLHDSYFRQRSFNDSFSDKGFIHRLGIAIDGYQKIADLLFGHKSQEAKHIRRTLKNEIGIKTLLIAKSLASSPKEIDRLYELTKKHYCDHRFKSQNVMLLLKSLPPRLLSSAIRIYRKVRRRRLSYG